MKNVPNIGGIHLLSGHLHGCEEKGRGREPLASWGDSSAGGWHVTAVTVLKGGGQATCCAPWSNYATRPPVRPSSLTPATLRTVLISCQEDQLPSLTIQHRWTSPSHPHLHPAIWAAIRSPANQPLKWLVKSGYGIQVRKERRSVWLCAKYSHN